MSQEPADALVCPTPSAESEAQAHLFQRPVEHATPGLPTRVYGAMLAIWQLRPALQRRFPLHKNQQRDWLRFLAWCAFDGRKDYAILREIPAWDRELNRRAILPSLAGDRWEDSFSVVQALHGISLYRWVCSPLLRSAGARSRVARFFWGEGRIRKKAPSSPDWQIEWLRRHFQSPGQLAKAVAKSSERHHEPDELVLRYGLNAVGKRCSESAETENHMVPIGDNLPTTMWPLPFWLLWLLEPVSQLWRPRPSQAEALRVVDLLQKAPGDTVRTTVVKEGFGVNLYGYAQGELGIGEDVRQVAKAIQSQGVPVGIINFQPGKNISQADKSADELLMEKPRYGINLFCMTGMEQTRYVCEQGLGNLRGRYNIGLWPWELPEWPRVCRHAYACVDEIWGISEYVAHAHRHAAPRPVIPMSLPVELGPVAELDREHFGLPKKSFLYFFAFDINSKAARKNPDGVIEAFQEAFPPGSSEDVGLVLKISHPETKCTLWRKIRRAARSDRRIHLVERTMRRPELLALFRVTNCFVSLHRAEGFGRCLAEALLLDKQVVTTNFSGNLDFCQEPRVALVRATMAPLESGDYMWEDGQSWAEPDISHAAELMRSVRENPRPNSKKDFVFDPTAAGIRYALRINEIWENRTVPR